jgi:hypothetical protein
LTLRLAIRFIDGSRRPLTRVIAARREEARAKVTEYVGKPFQAGEKTRIASRLTCLRELDGSTDPVKACFAGLQLFTLTRFLHANRHPPRIKSGAGFR